MEGALLDADFALRETEGNAKAFFRQGQVSVKLPCNILSTDQMLQKLYAPQTCFDKTMTSTV